MRAARPPSGASIRQAFAAPSGVRRTTETTCSATATGSARAICERPARRARASSRSTCRLIAASTVSTSPASAVSPLARSRATSPASACSGVRRPCARSAARGARLLDVRLARREESVELARERRDLGGESLPPTRAIAPERTAATRFATVRSGRRPTPNLARTLAAASNAPITAR